MLERVTRDDFIPHLHERFQVHLEGIDPIDLELVSVDVAGKAAQAGGRQPFSLHFLGPVSNKYLKQHIYSLQHAEMGELALFIVPLGPEEGRMRYEAIIA